MGKPKKNPRYDMISARVSFDEREALEKIAQKRKESIAETIRFALRSAFPGAILPL